MQLPPSSHSRAGAKYRIPIIHLGFALTGIVTTMLGPVLPALVSGWNLNDVQAGRLFTAQFVTAVIGSFLASRVISRLGAPSTVVIGMFLVAAGVPGIGVSGLSLGTVGICVYGLGLGFALPATNLLVAEILPDRRVAALNILNFSWTVGALAGPLLIAMAQRSIGLRAFVWMLSSAVALIAVFELIVLPKSGTAREHPHPGKLSADKRLPFAVLTCAFLMLYVGVENGFSGWLSVLAGRFHHAAAPERAVIQSAFWCAILLGRLVAPLVVRAISAAKIVVAGLVAAAIGVSVTVTAGGASAFVAGVIVTGIGLAALFPTVVVIYTEWYGTGGTGSIVLGVCGFGGAAVPFAVGAIGSYTGSLRIGFTANLACLLLAFVIFWRIEALVRAQYGDSTAA